MSPASDPLFASDVRSSGSSREYLRKAARAAVSQADVALVTGAVQFPLMCPSCGGPARRTLEVKRVVRTFRYSEDSPNGNEYETLAFAVPFCETCIQKHFGAVTAPNPWLIAKRLFLGPGAGGSLGAVIVLFVALFFAKEGIVNLSIFPLVFSMLPGAVAFFLLRKNWKANEYMSAPIPTDVTAAVEFTPNLALTFEPTWRAFRFRNAAFAEQFRALNAQRIWDPQGQQAHQARAKRRTRATRMNWLMAGVVAVLAIFGLWSEYGSYILDLLDRLR